MFCSSVYVAYLLSIYDFIAPVFLSCDMQFRSHLKSLVCHPPHSLELTYRSVIVQLCRFCWISPLKPTLLWRVMRGLYSISRGWVRLTH